MSIPVRGYAAGSPTAELAPFAFHRRDPRPDDVVIEILFCGVCHSDLHTARNDWGWTTYPIVPGHEIIGRVRSVGAGVTRFRTGDTVGVGCLVDACRDCAPCRRGEEAYCDHAVTTYGGTDREDGTRTQGGYSDSVVVSEAFVLRIPEGLDPRGAAPLLCAGITTWSPLRHWKAGPGTRVAVAGLGGLGHMALKFARAMGADVTLLTRSPQKEEAALRLGADRVLLTTDPAALAGAREHFDLIVDTIPAPHDLNPALATLALDGTLVLVGHLGPLDPFLNSVPLILRRRSVAGSFIGGIQETQEMLDFCGRHAITSDVEMIRIQDINHAYERLLKSDVHYRFVIDMASLME